ncbi:MAG TPA: glycosyltransferase, partial [Anaerolineaceae bacterium]|nr:glycosyltransferase [Anaerolineaceae bacterium]
MNILYVQAGQAVGGSKESLYQILRSLPDEFARQVVLERGSDPGFNERARRYASAVHLLPLPTWQQYRRRTLAERARAPLADAWRLLRCALAAFKIARVIRQERIDLVHTNNSMSPSGALAARLTATPHIWHVRESIGKHKQYPLLLGNLALRLMRRWSDTVICNSDYTAEVFREMRIPVRVIPNGLDLADFAPDAGTPRELGSLADLPPGEKRVGMVGNLTTKMKRHDVFLDIAALVKAAAPRT